MRVWMMAVLVMCVWMMAVLVMRVWMVAVLVLFVSPLCVFPGAWYSGEAW